MSGSAVIFTPDRNTGRKRDYTGAFRPAALAFAKRWKIPKEDVHAIDVSRRFADRGDEVLAILRNYRAVDTVAFFCHGLRRQIQLGFKIETVGELAEGIADAAQAKGNIVHVSLYACTLASGGVGGDGGFADLLRDGLCAEGQIYCRVLGHDRKGHTTWSPYGRVFDGDGSPVGGMGGRWIVGPGSQIWARWRRALRETDLKYRFPYMSIREVHEELVGAGRR